jgi:hypothetical protein
VKSHFRLLEEECRLARRLAAMPNHSRRRTLMAIASVELGILFRLLEI